MAISLIKLCWAIFLIFWVINCLRNKRTIKRGPLGHRWVYTVLVVLAFALLNGAGFNHRHEWIRRLVLPHHPVVNIVAVALTVLGLILAIWARMVLGTNWSGTVTFKEDHELIQHGPYAFMRHPIYTAILLMFLGSAVAVGSVGGFIGLAILYLSFWIKYQQEEAFMIEHFGDRYLDYMKRVRAIIPFVI